jgi:hypothetical protein
MLMKIAHFWEIFDLGRPLTRISVNLEKEIKAGLIKKNN